jgi:hypothetical protein
MDPVFKVTASSTSGWKAFGEDSTAKECKLFENLVAFPKPTISDFVRKEGTEKRCVIENFERSMSQQLPSDKTYGLFLPDTPKRFLTRRNHSAHGCNTDRIGENWWKTDFQ